MRSVWRGTMLAAAGAVWLAGCGSLFPSAELHYKLAVDVDVEGVIHLGEGVYRVGFGSEGPFLISGEHQWDVFVNGEAFPVELGNRGIMFVLMCPDSTRADVPQPPGMRSGAFSTAAAGRQALWSYFDFGVNDLPNGRAAQAKIEAFAKSKKVEDMPPTALPLLVRFRDVDDPRTIKRVDPKNLAASFGPGVSIVRVTGAATLMTDSSKDPGLGQSVTQAAGFYAAAFFTTAKW